MRGSSTMAFCKKTTLILRFFKIFAYSNRRIYYCCSTRGSVQTPISLPLDWPFYLIAYGSKTCQAVRGAMSNLEYIYYETEYLTILTKNDYAGAHPYGVTRDPAGHVIYYCYYRRKLHLIL